MNHSTRTVLAFTTVLIATGTASPPLAASTDDEPGSKDAKAGSTVRENRLAGESSPYLLLHKHNPVDWYPWGTEAFETAKREGKPVFLSIGYSSCYWCHVMERLVFSDEAIAEYMNEHFVNIKVDREERPDIDDIYMTSVIIYFQMIGSREGGGWPLSVFLTPDGQPFAGGTYFPPEDQGGRLGFPSVMRRITGLWKDRREDIENNAKLVTENVKRTMRPRALLTDGKLSDDIIDDAVAALRTQYDSRFGGLDFRQGNPDGPKFPVPSKLALLQHLVTRGGDGVDDDVEAMLETTLGHIARGGIRDHLAGGFHRYSTDRRWLVPHFEKMLYDQAQIAQVYSLAWERTKNPLYREAAQGVYDYVLSDMTGTEGGFHSALDAETDHIEGKYYVWELSEVDEVLSGDGAALFKRVYGLDQTSPFEHGHVLHLARTPQEVARELKIDETAALSQLATMRADLLKARSRRSAPLKDDKVLTSWNGLMIGSLAAGGRLLDRQDYIDAAAKTALFILKNLKDDHGALLRTWRNGQAKLNAYLDDYAFLVSGLLELHAATGEDRWLTAARELTDQQTERFWDNKSHGFYFTSHDHETLIARTRNAYDSVIPSGNSMSVRNLLRLAERTSDEKYRAQAGQTLRAFLPSMKQTPGGLTYMAIGLSEFLHGLPDDPGEGTTSALGNPTPPHQSVRHHLSRHNATEQALTSRSNEPPELLALADASYAAQIAPSLAGQGPGTKKRDEKKYVTAKIYLSTDKLRAGAKTKVVIWLDIKKGWHINANPARPDFLVPTEVEFESKLGTKMSKPRYPRGKDLKIDGFDESASVYEGKVPILVELSTPESAAGSEETMDITIHYQACNDKSCLRPMKIQLKGRKPVAGPGETVRQVNQDKFPKPRKPAR